MTSQPCGGVGNQCKTGGVAFGKTVFSKAADLFENSFGKFRRYSFGLHACDQALSMTLHPAATMPSRHVPSQLIGLARRIISGNHSQPHDLFLKKRHAEC